MTLNSKLQIAGPAMPEHALGGGRPLKKYRLSHDEPLGGEHLTFKLYNY